MACPPLQTEFESSDASPGFLLWRVSTRWQRAMRAALDGHDLTHAQFVMLASATYLEGRGEPVRQVDIANHASTDLTMTSQVLRTLESNGYVRRIPHPTDTRARSIRVTPAGRKKANEAVQAVEQADATFFKGLGAQRAAFMAALAGLAVDG